jgi:hypothetical protein
MRALARRYPFVNELLTARRPLVVAVAAALVLATNLAVFAYAIATAVNYVTVFGPVVGGDFVVFDAAAGAARQGDPAAIYDPDVLAQRLAAAFPERGAFRLSWQHPPTMLLLIFPLAFLPYLASYGLWAGATVGAFFFAARSIWNERLPLFLALATPAAFQSLITGQTGFLTAALLSTVALFADRRPVLAGLAAGLLTVKPQLGLLIPIVFAASGSWRAFAVAAATGLALAGASVAAFGAESWTAFLGAVAEHGGLMGSTVFPYHKLVSPFGGATMLGASAELAAVVQAAAGLLLAAAAAIVWRRTKETDLRLAILCAAAPLATPYAFYYEAAVFIPAVLALARRGAETGWLKGERGLIALLWAAPMLLPGRSAIPGIPLGFAFAALALAMVLRRAAAAGAFSPTAGERPRSNPDRSGPSSNDPLLTSPFQGEEQPSRRASPSARAMSVPAPERGGLGRGPSRSRSVPKTL